MLRTGAADSLRDKRSTRPLIAILECTVPSIRHSGFMKTLTLHVPDALLLQSGSSEESLTREAQWQLALRFFELGRLTSGQAADMCEINRLDFLMAASRAGVAVADLDGDELTQEIRNAGPV